MCWRIFCNFSLLTKNVKSRSKIVFFFQMSAILKFDFQKRKQLRFSEVNYLNYTKKIQFCMWQLHFPKTRGKQAINSRAVASLTVPGGQEFHFSHFFLKFWSIYLIFPQTLLIFFLILVLRVGGSPTREGPGYATDKQCTHSTPLKICLSYQHPRL